MYLCLFVHCPEFVHQCIRHILSFYSEAKNKPKSVVVVGHSMVCHYTAPSFDFIWYHDIYYI